MFVKQKDTHINIRMYTESLSELLELVSGWGLSLGVFYNEHIFLLYQEKVIF